MTNKTRQRREATLLDALIPIILTIGILMYTILVEGGDVHIPLVLGAIIVTLIAVYRLGFTWGEIEEGFINTIMGTMQAILILAIIGMIIGTWILGGIVPTLIYYGLQVLSPSFFLVASMILCSIVSRNRQFLDNSRYSWYSPYGCCSWSWCSSSDGSRCNNIRSVFWR